MTILRKLLGNQGEQKACDYLQQRGYLIIERNVRSRFGEIDLVAMDGKTLVFCEVRSRGGQALAQAAESIGVNKQHRLHRLASAYLQKRPEFLDHECRFDAVLVQKSGDTWSIRLIIDAFRPGW
ncbi:MAG: YraN family protein [Magnetococcales bacterium]|nr:YraN family protein [Magnetococcales bacterium]